MSYGGLVLGFGGVVTTDPFAELAAYCVSEGLAPDAFTRLLSEPGPGRAAVRAAETGHIPQRQLEVTLGRLLGVADDGLLTRALGGLRPREEVLELIAAARSAGIRVALLSNSWGSGDFDPYAGYDLDALFDAVVISGDAGLRKPDLAVYLLTAGELGVPAEDCVLADDIAANLRPAETLGMATVHFADPASGIREIRGLFGMP
jgi:putative hydrolase of the HAD superfamily